MPETDHFIRDDAGALLAMLKAAGREGVEVTGAEIGRKRLKALCAMAELPPRELAIVKDISCPGPAGDIPLRVYDARKEREPGPCVIFMHGGGFVLGDIEVYHSFCTEVAARLDLPVVSVEYRLAPEHPFPAAPDDCEAVARWIATSPAEVGRVITGLVLMGDSAGGNLAIVTSAELAETPAEVPVLVQAPIYPHASDVRDHESFRLFEDGLFLRAAMITWFGEQYGAEYDDPRCMPMAGDCSKAPPTVVCTTGLDPLRDSGREYAAHLAQQGTDVSFLEFPGIIHGFITLRKAIPSGQKDLESFLSAVDLMVERYK